MSQDTKYKNKFNKEKYDQFLVSVTKGKKEVITEHYKKQGYKSMNNYINTLIDHDMNGGGTERELSENSPSAKSAEDKLSDDLSSANTNAMV